MSADESTVLPDSISGGPLGLGDPNDRSLRKVEIEVCIPKIMREKAKQEKCSQSVKDFHDCCLKSGITMIVKCRKENAAMKECITNSYTDEEFRKECTEIYLKKRSDFRRTGIRERFKRA